MLSSKRVPENVWKNHSEKSLYSFITVPGLPYLQQITNVMLGDSLIYSIQATSRV